MAYERMLKKEEEPTLQSIREYVGENAFLHLCQLEELLEERYKLTKVLRFPFGNSYGWGYKYGHGATHLCYAFFEQNAFTVTIQVGDGQIAALEKIFDALTPIGRALWENRYPCGERGGWVHYRILGAEALEDILLFVQAKKAPLSKK